MRKAIAEFIGTFVLVLFGTGTAVLGGGIEGIGTPGIALAFGLSIVAMAYSIGTISGCHINPAVSIAMFINKRLSVKELVIYIVAQILGAIVATLTLHTFLISSDLATTNLGQNGFGNLTASGAFLVEAILTFVFVLVILIVTGKKGNAPFAGLVIGLTLVLIHLLGIPLTGTSVNPARSIAPAIFVGGEALTQLWLFIVAPIVGGILAAIVSKFAFNSEEN
ncbi:MIP channel s family protein [Listeria fleischmannii 1991]|uniref:Bacterial nodulin-like intrinsic protein n=2 Tax=Listeria fleischmannii TaxID=1069827 RepID=A0A2X3GQ14_9LIST|nr:MIP family channel protein [Listeria fleischmannii]EMG27644.1 aquaporin Z [Listeria fleischmannii subsp. fleischmannii LU2006-1]KMT58223.1 MIP channel s family protein [Listeria fleischmannii 1991]SQC70468.1 Bacterial nodulin-like intrinsic protein [Listeria fleischmannii subsp. fleischmannii]